VAPQDRQGLRAGGAGRGALLKCRKKNNVIEALDDRPSATPVLFGLTPHGRSVQGLVLDAVRSISLGQESGDADGVR
jgi:hypothetical protein